MPTPNIGLPTAPGGATDLSVAFNEATQIIDALTPLVVQDKDLNAPPATVAGDVGKRWIIGPSPTGAWAGKDGQIALCTGENLWTFIIPKVGFRSFVVDEGVDYMYSGSSWGIVSAGGLTERVPTAISQSSVFDGLSAATIANMRDGDHTTGTGTTSTGTSFIRLDLGEPKTVSLVVVAGGNLAGWGGVASYLNGRMLEYSNDDSNWTPILMISGATDYSPYSSRQVIEPTTARYWRLMRSNDYLATTRFQLFG